MSEKPIRQTIDGRHVTQLFEGHNDTIPIGRVLAADGELYLRSSNGEDVHIASVDGVHLVHMRDGPGQQMRGPFALKGANTHNDELGQAIVGQPLSVLMASTTPGPFRRRRVGRIMSVGVVTTEVLANGEMAPTNATVKELHREVGLLDAANSAERRLSVEPPRHQGL